MKGICVRSEIKPLKKVLLHRPGRELSILRPIVCRSFFSMISRF